eukprot:scaffold87057_cov24-Tisochrysis_lutea.AAC.3
MSCWAVARCCATPRGLMALSLTVASPRSRSSTRATSSSTSLRTPATPSRVLLAEDVGSRRKKFVPASSRAICACRPATSARERASDARSCAREVPDSDPGSVMPCASPTIETSPSRGAALMFRRRCKTPSCSCSCTSRCADARSCERASSSDKRARTSGADVVTSVVALRTPPPQGAEPLLPLSGKRELGLVRVTGRRSTLPPATAPPAYCSEPGEPAVTATRVACNDFNAWSRCSNFSRASSSCKVVAAHVAWRREFSRRKSSSRPASPPPCPASPPFAATGRLCLRRCHCCSAVASARVRAWARLSSSSACRRANSLSCAFAITARMPSFALRTAAVSNVVDHLMTASRLCREWARAASAREARSSAAACLLRAAAIAASAAARRARSEPIPSPTVFDFASPSWRDLPAPWRTSSTANSWRTAAVTAARRRMFSRSATRKDSWHAQSCARAASPRLVAADARSVSRLFARRLASNSAANLRAAPVPLASAAARRAASSMRSSTSELRAADASSSCARRSDASTDDVSGPETGAGDASLLPAKPSFKAS